MIKVRLIEKMHTVYVLKSKIKEKHYIGVTKDLNDRLERHNQGRSKWTKAYRPWKVIYTEQYERKQEALNREKKIKSYKGGEAFKKLIEN